MKLIPLEIQCSEPMSEATTFITDAIVNYSYDGEYAFGKDTYAHLLLDYAVHTIRYGKLASIYSEVIQTEYHSKAKPIAEAISTFLDTYFKEVKQNARSKMLELKIGKTKLSIPLSTIDMERSAFLETILAPYILPATSSEDEQGILRLDYTEIDAKVFSLITCNAESSEQPVYNFRMKALAIVMAYFRAAFQNENQFLRFFYSIAEHIGLIESKTIEEMKANVNISPSALWNVQRGYVANYLKDVDKYYLKLLLNREDSYDFYHEFALPIHTYPPTTFQNQKFYSCSLTHNLRLPNAKG